MRENEREGERIGGKRGGGGGGGWYSLSGGAYSCQGICLLIIGPWHVKELAPVKISADLLDEEAVACHVCILGVPVARRQLDHQVGVAIAQDPANAKFFGKPEPVNERLVLGDVVGGGKMDL